MDLTSFCIVIAVLESLFAIPNLLFPARGRVFMQAFLEDEMRMRSLGVGIVLLSVLALWSEPRLSMDLAGVIRATAWIAAVKGLGLAWWPSRMLKAVEHFWSSEGLVRLYGALGLAASAFFFWAACKLS